MHRNGRHEHRMKCIDKDITMNKNKNNVGWIEQHSWNMVHYMNNMNRIECNSGTEWNTQNAMQRRSLAITACCNLAIFIIWLYTDNLFLGCLNCNETGCSGVFVLCGVVLWSGFLTNKNATLWFFYIALGLANFMQLCSF